ncbi:MAG: hypothetical protein U5M51_09265 [Emticicia sp.]|nr:hypothetical protein [Emticicia sp.]
MPHTIPAFAFPLSLSLSIFDKGKLLKIALKYGVGRVDTFHLLFLIFSVPLLFVFFFLSFSSRQVVLIYSSVNFLTASFAAFNSAAFTLLKQCKAKTKVHHHSNCY